MNLLPLLKWQQVCYLFFKWNSVHIHHVSAQRDTKFERAWKFSFSRLLDSYGYKLFKINVISQINFLTPMDWKYPTKAQVNLLVNAQYCFVKRKFRCWLVNCKNCRTVKKKKKLEKKIPNLWV